MPFDIGINFRATSGYVIDGPNETYCIGDLYPTTRGGVTFGWDAAPAGTRDRVTSNDRRLAGVNFDNVLNRNWRLDLPAAVSTDVHCAAGDAATGNPTAFDFLDNATNYFSLNTGSGSSNNFEDSTNVEYTASSWYGSEMPSNRVFASTIFKLNVRGVGNNVIAHMRFVQGIGPLSVYFSPSMLAVRP